MELKRERLRNETTPSSRKEKVKDIVVCDIRNFVTGAFFQEKAFRQALRKEDWTKYEGKRVLIRGCGKGPAIPQWAYMVLMGHLLPYSRAILYGEECAPIVIYKKTDRVNQQEKTDG